jgi:hypothetical protein
MMIVIIIRLHCPLCVHHSCYIFQVVWLKSKYNEKQASHALFWICKVPTYILTVHFNCFCFLIVALSRGRFDLAGITICLWNLDSFKFSSLQKWSTLWIIILSPEWATIHSVFYFLHVLHYADLTLRYLFSNFIVRNFYIKNTAQKCLLWIKLYGLDPNHLTELCQGAYSLMLKTEGSFHWWCHKNDSAFSVLVFCIHEK